MSKLCICKMKGAVLKHLVIQQIPQEYERFCVKCHEDCNGFLGWRVWHCFKKGCKCQFFFRFLAMAAQTWIYRDKRRNIIVIRWMIISKKIMYTWSWLICSDHKRENARTHTTSQYTNDWIETLMSKLEIGLILSTMHYVHRRIPRLMDTNQGTSL